MSRMTDVPVEIVYIVQSIVILFVAAERFLSGFKHKCIPTENLSLFHKGGGKDFGVFMQKNHLFFTSPGPGQKSCFSPADRGLLRLAPAAAKGYNR